MSVGGDLFVGNNRVLTDLELPTLTSLGGGLRSGINPALPTCAAYAIRDQLRANGFSGSVSITNNLETCP